MRQSSNKFIALSLLGAMALLAGCDSLTDTLGMGRNPPDEFAVVDRPPLSMPPDFSLRPPRPGAPRPQEALASQRAGETLFGPGARISSADDRGVDSPDASSELERSMLASAGASRADPSIRSRIDREATQKVSGSQHLVEDLLWWRQPESDAPVVNAPEEAARLREARESGAPVNKGATPVIERRHSGWLGL